MAAGKSGSSTHWQDGEEDHDLSDRLEEIFTYKWLEKCEALKAEIKDQDQLVKANGSCFTEKQKETHRRQLKRIKKLCASYRSMVPSKRQVPDLKVLSAIAVCTHYKDSQEIFNPATGGRFKWCWTDRSKLVWNRHNNCQQYEEDSDWRCGFCRF